MDEEIGKNATVKDSQYVTIGEAAKLSGLSTKAIRYYNAIKLVVPNRKANGYRHYDSTQIAQLRIVAQGRALGFSTDECRQLISVVTDEGSGHPSETELRAVFLSHLDDINRKISELTAIRIQLLSCFDDDALRGQHTEQTIFTDHRDRS